MAYYRVKQIDDNKFIPQVKSWLFGDWFGIDDKFSTWWVEEYQIKRCQTETLDEAKETINKYKSVNSKYPKYHKV